MGRRNFHGPVRTLADSCEADFLVLVKCLRCETSRQMHPYRLVSRHKRILDAALDQPLPGFFCRTCRSSVSVVISCTYTHPGG
jgi:hypothetical protein